MAFGYVSIAVIALVVGIITFGIPLLLAEVFPWKSLWKQRHGRPPVTTKSYKGRTVMITGANGAFGSRACKIVGLRDVDTLIMVDLMDCATVKKDIEDELRKQNKPIPKILIWQIDMMSFKGCQELGNKARDLKNLDHVLLTAGILSFSRKESPEGWETSIQVNFLSSALIGLLLLPVLKSSPGNPNPPVLTFVTTFGVYPASFTMSVPKNGSYIRSLSDDLFWGEQAHQYGRSKGLLLYFTRELAERAAAAEKQGKGLRKVTICSADPGSAWTPLTNPNKAKLIPRLIMNLGARDPQVGATALINAASSPSDAHGKIMMDFETAQYPPFFNRKSGHVAQQRVWQEAQAEFESKVPEAKSIYQMLDV